MKNALVKTIDTELVVSASVVNPSDRAQRALAYHHGVLRSFSQQMGYAFLCGLELNAVKEELAHGQFEKWREEFLPQLPRSTAHQYRTFADLLQSKCAAVAKLSNRAAHLLTSGDFSEEDRAEILQAVHDAANGKTLNGLYRALGVVPQLQKQKHNPPKLTAAEAEAAKVDTANVEAIRLANELRALRNNAERHSRITPENFEALFNEVVDTSVWMRERRKAHKPSRPGKKKGRK